MLKTKYMLNADVARLRQEVRRLKSVIISIIGRDQEGGYNPVFAEEILAAAQEDAEYEFKGSQSFMLQLKRV